MTARRSPFLEAAYRVRDLVNDSRPEGRPIWRHEWFGSVCAAMDVIDDAHEAIGEYLRRPDGRIGYLEIYGVFQALVLQQDGVCELMKALGVDGYPADDPRLKKAREIRNDVTGHPSRRKWGPTLATQLSRNEMTRSSCRIARHARDGGAVSYETIQTIPLIASQEECLVETLQSLASVLEEREREHRRLHRDEKLQNLFPPYLDYAIQKVDEAADQEPGSAGASFALTNVGTIEGTLTALGDALEKRELGRDAAPFVWLSIDQVTNALESVRSRLSLAGRGASDEDRAVLLTALACLIRRELDRLSDMAMEIDADYAADEAT